MSDIVNLCRPALLAYELGSYCADFRYRFQLRALCTQDEINQPEARGPGLLFGLLQQIRDHLKLVVIATDGTTADQSTEAIEHKFKTSVEALYGFFGSTNALYDALSEERQEIVTDFTLLEEFRSELSEEDYGVAVERLEILVRNNIPALILHAEGIGRSFPNDLRVFFLLGSELKSYSNECWSIQVELDHLRTRKERYFNLCVKPVLRGFHALLRECASKIPEANIHVREVLDPTDIQSGIDSLDRHILGQLRIKAEAQPASKVHAKKVQNSKAVVIENSTQTEILSIVKKIYSLVDEGHKTQLDAASPNQKRKPGRKQRDKISERSCCQIVVAALKVWHKFETSEFTYDPVGVHRLAEIIRQDRPQIRGGSKSSVGRAFKVLFGSHKKYKICCAQKTIIGELNARSGEYSVSDILHKLREADATEMG